MARLLCLAAAGSVAATYLSSSGQVPLSRVLTPSHHDDLTDDHESLCPQVGPLHPTMRSKVFDQLLHALHEQGSFQQHAFEALGQAVRIP